MAMIGFTRIAHRAGLSVLLVSVALPLPTQAQPNPAQAAQSAARQAFLPWRNSVAATVLIGADVPSGIAGLLVPADVVLRLKELNRLPALLASARNPLGATNALPAGTTECVLDAQANANLSSERATVRLRSVRCFDAQGAEVLARDLAGYAVDKDGRVGLKSPVAWSPAAKELLLTGAGAQERSSGLGRLVGSALGRATLGLSDTFTETPAIVGASPDTLRELRSMDTLLPTLTLEPGRELELVAQPMLVTGPAPASAANAAAK
jgi:hypothetical protein